MATDLVRATTTAAAAAAGALMLPSSPNWYASAVGDVSLTGVYAFGCKNIIRYRITVLRCSPPMVPCAPWPDAIARACRRWVFTRGAV